MRIELNIGLDTAGRDNTPATRDALAERALSRLCGSVIESARYETAYQGPDGDTTEPGLFVRLETNNFFLIIQSVYILAALLGQDCISVYSPDFRTGRLVGPHAGKWGAFDLDFFFRPEAEQLQVAA